MSYGRDASIAISSFLTALVVCIGYFLAPSPAPSPAPEPVPVVPDPPKPDPLDPADAPVVTARNSRGERLPSADLAALISASKLDPDAYRVETLEVGKQPIISTVVVGGAGPVPPPAPPRPPSPQPEPTPTVDAAFFDVQRIIRAGDKDKAAQVAEAWEAFAEVCAVHPPATTGALRESLAEYEKLAFANTPLAGAFPGFSAAANAGLLKLLGDADRPLATGEAASAIRKLAEACK